MQRLFDQVKSDLESGKLERSRPGRTSLNPMEAVRFLVHPETGERLEWVVHRVPLKRNGVEIGEFLFYSEAEKDFVKTEHYLLDLEEEATKNEVHK